MGITKHVCGKCGKKFDQESSYLKHVCPTTGFSPADPKHFDLAFKVIPKKTPPKGKSIVLSEKIIFEAVKEARRKPKHNV